MVQPVLSGIQHFLELVQPYVEFIEKHTSQIYDVIATVENVSFSFRAVEKMGEAQFVYWYGVSREFINEIISCDNTDKCLIKFLKDDTFFSVEDTIEMRNKYIHGTNSKDEQIHFQDYLEFLKIMVLIIIKINEEFCLKYPIQ